MTAPWVSSDLSACQDKQNHTNNNSNSMGPCLLPAGLPHPVKVSRVPWKSKCSLKSGASLPVCSWIIPQHLLWLSPASAGHSQVTRPTMSPAAMSLGLHSAPDHSAALLPPEVPEIYDGRGMMPDICLMLLVWTLEPIRSFPRSDDAHMAASYRILGIVCGLTFIGKVLPTTTRPLLLSQASPAPPFFKISSLIGSSPGPLYK